MRNLKLEHEQEKNKILSEALETLATEHHELEQSLVKGSPPLSILSEEQFYDAVSGKWWCPECERVGNMCVVNALGAGGVGEEGGSSLTLSEISAFITQT